VEGDKAGVNGEGDSGEMEVVKEHWQMVMETPGGRKVELQTPSRDTSDGIVLLGGESLVAEPQLDRQLEIGPLQSLLNLKKN